MAYFKKGKNKSKQVVGSQLAEWSFPKPEDSGSIKAKRNFYLAFFIDWLLIELLNVVQLSYGF